MSQALQSSGLITDDLLESLSPDLTSLEYLNILGCPRVTYRGVWSIISKTVHGIIGLGLENLAHTFVRFSFALYLLSWGLKTFPGYGYVQ